MAKKPRKPTRYETYLGSIRGDDGRLYRAYWQDDENGRIVVKDARGHYQPMPCACDIKTFEQAAEAALDIWRGKEWGFVASAELSWLYGGIVRKL